MRRIILHLLATAAAFYFISLFLNGDFGISGGWKGYLVVAIIFGLLNSLVKPILKILSLPIMLMTAGLFSLVLNMFILWFAKYLLDVLAFEGIGIYAAHVAIYFYAGFLLAIANMFIQWLTHR